MHVLFYAYGLQQTKGKNMKQSLKVLVLGCMTIGALAGCEWGESSKSSQKSLLHSQHLVVIVHYQPHPQMILVTHLLVLVHPQQAYQQAHHHQVHPQAWHQLLPALP